MGDFFDARLGDYEEHQLTCIESAQEFYPFTAGCLPQVPGSRVLDLDTARAWSSDTALKLSPRRKSRALTSRLACLARFATNSPANP